MPIPFPGFSIQHVAEQIAEEQKNRRDLAERIRVAQMQNGPASGAQVVSVTQGSEQAIEVEKNFDILYQQMAEELEKMINSLDKKEPSASGFSFMKMISLYNRMVQLYRASGTIHVYTNSYVKQKMTKLLPLLNSAQSVVLNIIKMYVEDSKLKSITDNEKLRLVYYLVVIRQIINNINGGNFLPIEDSITNTQFGEEIKRLFKNTNIWNRIHDLISKGANPFLQTEIDKLEHQLGRHLTEHERNMLVKNLNIGDSLAHTLFNDQLRNDIEDEPGNIRDIRKLIDSEYQRDYQALIEQFDDVWNEIGGDPDAEQAITEEFRKKKDELEMHYKDKLARELGVAPDEPFADMEHIPAPSVDQLPELLVRTGRFKPENVNQFIDGLSSKEKKSLLNALIRGVKQMTVKEPAPVAEPAMAVAAAEPDVAGPAQAHPAPKPGKKKKGHGIQPVTVSRVFPIA